MHYKGALVKGNIMHCRKAEVICLHKAACLTVTETFAFLWDTCMESGGLTYTSSQNDCHCLTSKADAKDALLPVKGNTQ